MSDDRRVLLVGATGLVGNAVMGTAGDQSGLRLVALARREAPIPRGSRMEMLVAPTAQWPKAIASIAPNAIICALGTTMRKAGGEQAFRAIDYDLVLSVAGAARDAGVENFVLVSSVGADSSAKAFYLRVKGEVEAALGRLRFRRLDILRPGLLRGKRDADRRTLETLGAIVSPITDLIMFGSRTKYRSVAAWTVGMAAIQCTREKAAGHFVHENDAIIRLAKRLETKTNRSKEAPAG